MADSNEFKLSYCLRRQIIYLLDRLNEFLLIKKLNCKNLNDDQYQFIKNEIKILIDKINDLQLINNEQRKKIKFNNNDVIYLEIEDNFRKKIIEILSNNKVYCFTNLETIILRKNCLIDLIKDNNELINELQNLNDFNFNSIIIEQENQNQINSSSNLNQNQLNNTYNQNQLSNLNQSSNANIQINIPSNVNVQNQLSNTNNQSINIESSASTQDKEKSLNIRSELEESICIDNVGGDLSELDDSFDLQTSISQQSINSEIRLRLPKPLITKFDFNFKNDLANNNYQNMRKFIGEYFEKIPDDHIFVDIYGLTLNQIMTFTEDYMSALGLNRLDLIRRPRFSANLKNAFELVVSEGGKLRKFNLKFKKKYENLNPLLDDNFLNE